MRPVGQLISPISGLMKLNGRISNGECVRLAAASLMQSCNRMANWQQRLARRARLVR
jgi:hypothetical protein